MFDPDRFFAQAERLAQFGEGEEDHRSAISRAYYACHLTARDRMFGVDGANWGTQGRRPSHYAVIAAAAKFPLIGIDSDRFERLKLMREKADYLRDPAHPEVASLFARYSIGSWSELAGEALVIARDLLPRLRRLLPAGPAT